MNEAVIETHGLTKVFGTDPAVDGLDLSVPRGSVFGFLGPNGAGKTTTLRMLVAHLHPTQGEIRVLGGNPWRLSQGDRQRVAYVSENMSLPGWMKPAQAIRLNASFYPKWDHRRAEALLDRFELRKAGRYRTLSKGQKRRLCLLLALCSRAELLILDEPGSGLDVAARREFLDELLEHVCDGDCTVFFSSHLLSDLERVVDRVAILKQGTLCLTGELEALKDSARNIQFTAAVPREAIEEHFRILRYNDRGQGTEVSILGFDEDRFRALCAAHPGTAEAEVRGFNLEDLFVEVIRGGKPEGGRLQ